LPEEFAAEEVTQTKSESLARTLSRESQSDPDLALILDRWPTLPEPIMAAIRALVGSVAGPS
jgi:hypothetical protein